MGSGPGASAWGEGEPSEAPRTFRTLRNSLSSLELAGPSVSPGLALAPSVPARPPLPDRFSIPRSFLLRGSPGHPHRRVLSPVCPRSAGRSSARPRAARLSCFPPAERCPSAPSTRLRVGLAGIQAGKVPGSGAAASRRRCRRAPGARSLSALPRPLPRVGIRDFPTARPSGKRPAGGGGGVRGLCGPACALRASGRSPRGRPS